MNARCRTRRPRRAGKLRAAVVVATAGIALAGAPAAFAEEAEPYPAGVAYVPYVGARIGYIQLEEVDDDGSFTFGLTGGVFFRPRWSAEASLAFQESEFFLDLGNVAVSVPVTTRETWAFQVGLSVSPWPEQVVRPYVIGGVGYFLSTYDSDFTDSDRESDGGWFWGAGLDLLGEEQNLPVSIVIEARWLFTRKEEYFDQGIRADGVTASVGVRYRFR